MPFDGTCKTVLVLEDDSNDLPSLESALGGLGFEAVSADVDHFAGLRESTPYYAVMLGMPECQSADIHINYYNIGVVTAMAVVRQEPLSKVAVYGAATTLQQLKANFDEDGIHIVETPISEGILGEFLKEISVEERVLGEFFRHSGYIPKKMGELPELTKQDKLYVNSILNAMNNFYWFLPFNDEYPDELVPYWGKFEGWDVKYKDNNYLKETCEKGSLLLANQTPHEFYSTINDAIIECGTDRVRLKQLCEMLPKDKTPESSREIALMLLPVYVRLREKGYSSYDLYG
jgi:hypothetical protein